MPVDAPPLSSATRAAPRLSSVAAGIVGSEILKIAAEIRAMRDAGERVANLTVGDFDPAQFRIPRPLEDGIVAALRAGETNYPPSSGIAPLKKAVATLYERVLGLRYDAATSVLITGGSRPGIYGTYRTLVDAGDRVVYPVPSWNNNHYCHLIGAEGVPVPCSAEQLFLPTRELLSRAVREARLLALCSPLNPAGTAFTADALAGICDLVLEENVRRESLGARPLYVLYDQVYWMLTFGATEHHTPVALRPEMARYTIFVDGISKAFAATGVRVGWVVGPPDVMGAMSDVLGHVGAWAPRAEQVATAAFLADTAAVADYRTTLVAGLQSRLDAIYDGIRAMQRDGLPIEAVAPMGAIYLSVRVALNGRRTPSGNVLHTNEDIRRYLLQHAGVAVVPFQAFGSRDESGWFRLSVGAVSNEEIAEMMPRLREAVGTMG